MFKIYKVVRVESNGRLSSACTRDDFPQNFRVYYEVGKMAKPKIKESMLFAFTDLDDAMDFCGTLSNHKVYLASSPKIYKNIKPQSFITHDIQSRLLDFWNALFEAKQSKKKMDKAGIPMQFCYASSVCCPSIKLIKEIHV